MLEIEHIELEKYRGFQLNNIKKFSMKVTSNITVLLGRNGCGKSMLMLMLAPLCPNKKLFKVGGSRDLTIKCTKGRFLLTNVRVQAGMKNTITNLDTSEVLIKDSNPSVFDEMVSELTGYDKDIHQLLMGNVRLSTMSTPERKKWFSMLSESDLSFALKFYAQARKRQRSLSGGIDTLKEELGELQVKVLESDAEYDIVKERRNELTTELGNVDRELAGANGNVTITEAVVMKQLETIEEINRQILRLDPFIPADLVNADEFELDKIAGEVRTSIGIYSSELERIHKRLYELKKLDTIDVKEVNKKLAEAEQEAASLVEEITLVDTHTEFDESAYTSAISWYNTYGSSWLEQLAAFSISGFEYSDRMSLDNISESLMKHTTALEALRIAFNKAQNLLAVYNERLHHIESCTEVTCDSCGNEFKPGVKAGEAEQLIQDRKALEAELVRLDAERSIEVAIVGKYTELSYVLSNLSAADKAIANNPVLVELRDMLPDEVFDGMGATAVAWAEGWLADVKAVVRLRAVERSIEKIKIDRALILAAKGQDTTELERRQDELDQTVFTLNNRLTNLTYDIDRIKTIRSTMDSFARLDQTLNEQWASYQRSLYQLTENIRIELLFSQRHEINELLNETLKRMNEMDDCRRRMADIENQLKRTEVKYIQSGKIVKAMSPEEGVLAKHLYRCITSVTELMTTYINAMWGYEMKVLPCNINNGELDYQFGLWAGNSENAIDDVSEGSFAQKGVVDFVFMLTAYKAKKLDKFPLFLDELGSNFDEGHGDEMISFVKGLLNKGQHSQVFMISHNSNQHFQLTNADMVVLDKKGITLPSNYNRYVEIH